MGKIEAGILSAVRGKVSGVVGGTWKDKAYLRAYVIPANPNTASQQTQRTKFSDVVEFAKPLVGPVFNAYTDKFQRAMSGFNYFVKANIAIFDGSPVWSSIKLTEGKLFFGGINSAVYTTGTGVTVVNFSNGIGNNGALTDKIYAAIYNTSTGLWYFPADEVLRSAAAIDVPGATGMTATDLAAYCWAVKYDGTQVSLISDSDYQIGEAA